MGQWQPISDKDFAALFESQYRELTAQQREVFDRHRIPFCKVILKRSDHAGEEFVFIVAQKDDGVLYFDDVEYGFNIATINKSKHILNPGGSQNCLSEAIDQWFPRSF